MRIIVNGQEMEVSRDISIADLLQELEMDSRRVAVECNRELITRSKHRQTYLAKNDQLEIVTLVGGG